MEEKYCQYEMAVAFCSNTVRSTQGIMGFLMAFVRQIQYIDQYISDLKIDLVKITIKIYDQNSS